jgi:hypothetical protein
VAEYEATAKKLKQKIRSAKRNMEKKLAGADPRNKKPFYNYIKKKTKATETVGPLRSATGAAITDSMEMANELNKNFGKVFTREDMANKPTATQHTV